MANKIKYFWKYIFYFIQLSTIMANKESNIKVYKYERTIYQGDILHDNYAEIYEYYVPDEKIVFNFKKYDSGFYVEYIDKPQNEIQKSYSGFKVEYANKPQNEMKSIYRWSNYGTHESSISTIFVPEDFIEKIRYCAEINLKIQILRKELDEHEIEIRKEKFSILY